jgi:hypothetical protein
VQGPPTQADNAGRDIVFVVGVDFPATLRAWLHNVLIHRFSFAPSAKQTVTTFSFKSPVIDQLPLRTLLNDANLQVDLPAPQRTKLDALGPLCVGFRYEQCLGLRMANHATFAKGLTPAEAADIRTRPCLCELTYKSLAGNGSYSGGV